MALLAGRAVGDVAHRVDRLMRRAGGDDDLAAGQRLRPAVEQRLDRGDDLQRLGHAAFAGLVAFGHLALGRADEGDAVLGQRRAVAARRGCDPHFRVHRRRHQHLLVGGEKHGRGKIVGMAVGELGHQVGGGRRDHQKVGLARQPDMADIVLVIAVEQFGEDMVGRQRADRQRGDEFLRGCRHHHAHRRTALAQPADQVERLVGGNAAADDEQDALAGEVPRGNGLACATAAAGACWSAHLPVRAASVSISSMRPACPGWPSTAARIITRACSSIEQPFSAASWRSRSLTSSSRLRMVMLAM